MINKDYVLINSSYSLAKGKDVVFTLIDDKINFLKVEVLNTLLTTDLKDDHKNKRIKELQKVREDLENLLAGLEGDENIEVFCELKIKIP